MRSYAILGLCLAVVAASGCKRSSRRNASVDQVVTIGGMTSDPLRERVYVSDAGNGRILALSSRTGAIDQQLAFGTILGGVDINDCASILFVSVKGDQRVDTVSLSTFSVDLQEDVTSAPENVGDRSDQTVLAVTDAGLVQLDLTDGSEVLVSDLVQPDALLIVSRDGSTAFVAQTRADSVDVLRIDIDNPGGAIQAAKLAQSPVTEDRAAGMALSFDEQLVFVGSLPGIQVLDANTLGLVQFLPVQPPALNAFTVNPPGTRAYFAVGSADVQSINLDPNHFTPGRMLLTDAPVQDRGLLMAADGLTVFSHEEDSVIRSYTTFDLRLEGPGIALQGVPYSLTLQGDPGDQVILFASFGAGFVYLEDPDSNDPLFMDQDPASRFFVVAGTLDADGNLLFECNPRDFEDVGELDVILQAISFGAEGGFKDVSNPLVVRVRFSCDGAIPNP